MPNAGEHCAQKGYPLVIVMAENFSTERRRLMRILGAKVVLTPAARKGTGMLAKARELAKLHGWFLTDQFANPANAEVRARTTAMEIQEDFRDTRLDYFVTGIGAGGTLAGVGSKLRQYSPDTRIIAVEPDNSPILSSGLRNDPVTGVHPWFSPHPMQGWSPKFIPEIAQNAMDQNLIDDFVLVSGEEAMKTARNLAGKEGILCGISSGATLAAALDVACTAPAGSNILAMVPDTGERYLSTPLFSAVDGDMNEEEIRISQSKLGYRFSGQPVENPHENSKPPAALTQEAVAFLNRCTRQNETPVVMFSLEWCEFCWSVRNLFAACDVPYQSVDLDAADFAGGQTFGTEVRQALLYRTEARTIPQIFVGGTHVGGATETFDAYNGGRLLDAFSRAGVACNTNAVPDAYQFLPKWLQGR